MHFKSNVFLDYSRFYLILEYANELYDFIAKFRYHLLTFVPAVQINDITFYIANLNDVFHVCLSSFSILRHQKENFEFLKKNRPVLYAKKITGGIHKGRPAKIMKGSLIGTMKTPFSRPCPPPKETDLF